MGLIERLRGIQHIALDLDGTLYKGNTLFAQTPDFLASMQRLGIGLTYLTNNPSYSLKDYQIRLNKMGIHADVDQIQSSSRASIVWIQREWPRVRRIFLVGTPSMAGEWRESGFELTEDSATDIPDAVVVSFDPTVTYERLGRAAWWIQMGKPYLATNPDRVCPTDKQTVLLDCGALCSALKTATGREPDIILGKPDPAMLDTLLSRHCIERSQMAMVGDRLYTDMLMAKRCNVLAVLVLTGETTRTQAFSSTSPPDVVVEDIGKFGSLLEMSRIGSTSEADMKHFMVLG